MGSCVSSAPLPIITGDTRDKMLPTLKSAEAQNELIRLCTLLVHGYARTHESQKSVSNAILDLCFGFYFDNERHKWDTDSNCICQICDERTDTWHECQILQILTDEQGRETLRCQYQMPGMLKSDKTLPRYSPHIKPLVTTMESLRMRVAWKTS